MLLFMWAGEVGNLQWLMQEGDAEGSDDLQQGWIPLPLKCSDSGWSLRSKGSCLRIDSTSVIPLENVSACGLLLVKFVSEGRKYNYAILIYFFFNEASSVTEHRI